MAPGNEQKQHRKQQKATQQQHQQKHEVHPTIPKNKKRCANASNGAKISMKY